MEQKNRRISTRQLVSMAMLGAISIVLVAVIHFPLIPAAAFLEYDPADIPILICAFAYGPLAGLLLTVVVCFIQGFTVSAQSGIIGIVMHIFATGCCVLVTGNIYIKKQDEKNGGHCADSGGIGADGGNGADEYDFYAAFHGCALGNGACADDSCNHSL